MQQNNIEEIRKQILNKYNLRIGDRIKYDLLHTIYQEYVELFDEKTFAQEVLQISYGSYCQIKYDLNKRAILLKDEKVDIDLIREEILQRFSLYDKLLEYEIDKKRGYLFQKDGEFIHATNFNARFQKLCKNAEIRVYTKKTGIKSGRKTKKIYQCDIKKRRVNTHMLRYTFATRCIESGVSPVVLQRNLGHKDIKVTLNTYTSVFHDFKEKEIEKINSIF